MLSLHGSRGHVLLVRRGLLLRCRLHRRAAGATVEAGPCDIRIVDHGLAIDIGDRDTAEIIDGLVVGEHAIVPASTLVTDAAITVAVIDATVETDMRSPISGIPSIIAVVPAPIAGRPKQPHGGWLNPGAWNPKISVRTISPIAGCPDVAGRRNFRLLVNWKLRRSNRNADDLCRRGSRDGHRGQCGQNPNNKAKTSHACSP